MGTCEQLLQAILEELKKLNSSSSESSLLQELKDLNSRLDKAGIKK